MRNLTKKSILKLKQSSTLVINEKCKELIKRGKKVYQFGFGQSPFPVPEKIVNALKDNAHRKEYLPIQGLGKLREAISKDLKKKIGVNYPSTNIVITPGSKEAMLLLHVAFNGEIILSAPSWVSYEPQAVIGRNKVHWIKTTRESNWFPTAKQLDQKAKSLKNKNLIFILNSPNNPSGTICKNLRELAAVAKKHKLIVLSDEIYTDLTFCRKYESISQYYPERTCISGGLSKWCGAGGWRVGFFAVPDKLSNLLENVKTLASESYSTVNSPAQFAAAEAYSSDFSNYKNKTINILQSVGSYVYNNLKSNKVLINQPQGAFYLMPEFPNKKFKTSTELCEKILDETGVAMLPASDFGFNPKKMLTRLCYIDFDGTEFLNAEISGKVVEDKIIEKYAPNVVEGVKRLSNWAKNL
tara:strand:+ start:4100 stop:5335 length:1236 start_codon:yes stop_codon:yes gene_type:complete